MNIKKFNLKQLNLNKTKILIITLIVTISVFLIGISYAYFQNQFGDDARSELEILSGTVDNLFFDIEKPLYINASVFNFGSGKGNIQDDADATATLVPNNTTYEATASYNIYLVIEENELEYTTEEHTPELVFNVTDPNGNEVENITGLLHYENGFDITTRTGGFLIASDYVIEANNAVTNQVWNISIEFVNLDSNQNANLDKNFSAKIYMTTDKMSSYNPIQVTNIEANPTYNTVDTTLSLTNGTAPAEKYYFAIEEADTTTGYINNNNGVVRLNNTLAASDTIEYTEHDDVNYEFTNLKENTEYIIYGYVEDINGIKSNVYSTSITTNEYVLPSVNEVTHSVTLNSITLTVNAENGDGNVVTYMYSKDNGVSWETSASNTYTFNYLNDTTEYKIKVKVVDSNGRESTEYYEAISTETYILPTVANVDYTTAYNSITLTPTGTEGTNPIDHYEYSIDNGSYQTSNVFGNLTEQTEYTINVKAIDSAGRESNPYTIEVTTDIYQVPTITNVSTSSTTNSITINVSASNGDGTITKYMYSRDNGSNWYESTSNSYTFSGLTSNTTFYIQVKVVDNNDRESAVSNTTEQTQYLNPTVNNVSTSNITAESITLTVTASAGSNNVSTYYYSKNNGSSYVSSTSNTYTFTGLEPETTYNFSVYVEDSAGHNSEAYTLSEITAYAPTVTIASNNSNSYSPTSPAMLNCADATASYNQKYRTVNISQINNKYTSCNLTYQAPSSKTYLNNYIIGLTGTTQGNGRVVDEANATIYNYANASNVSLSTYSSYRRTYNSYSSSTEYSTSSAITFNSSTLSWVTNPSAMRSAYDYHLYFYPSTSGYYQICYNIDAGHAGNDLVVSINGEKVNTFSAETSYEVSGCEDLGYLTTSNQIKITHEAGSNDYYSMPSITFSLQRATLNRSVDTGYRYEGKSPNNFIWFNDELWQIIGVFGDNIHGVSGQNLVKIIKYTPNMYYNFGTYSNLFGESSIKNILNDYYNSSNSTSENYCYYSYRNGIKGDCDFTHKGIKDEYRQMIANAKWYSGDINGNTPVTQVFGNEFGFALADSDRITNAYVGLINASDFGYSYLSSNCSRSQNMYDYDELSNCIGNSWLYNIPVEWTVSPLSDRYVMTIYSDNVNAYSYYSTAKVRPVVYLNSNVYLISGNGTMANPYVVGV